jgi:hypothetical protein
MNEDRGARRNRNEGGLWLINALLSVLVALLSLYVFRAPETRANTDAALQVVETLPRHIGPSQAMAASRDGY